MPERFLTVVAALATVVAATTVGIRVSRARQDPTLPMGLNRTIVPEWRSYSPHGLSRGNPRAPVTLVVFSDYLCVYCAAMEDELSLLLRGRKAEVRVVVRHNPHLGELSEPAAIAAECAFEQGAFEDYHQLLFQQVDSFGFKPWSAIAAEAGVTDTGRFSACLSSEPARARVEADRAAAERLQVRATPTLLLDSLLLVGSPGLAYLDGYVTRVAARAR